MMKISRLVTFLVIVCLAFTSTAISREEAEKKLNELLSCSGPMDQYSPCNMFVGRALERLYGVKDFKTGSDKFLLANEIAAHVATSSDWVYLGEATDQNALTQAQGYANQGRAIIAVRAGDTNGHVAVVLPGTTTQSGKWNLKAPNSASFLLNEPKLSYVGKPLSHAFGSPAGVKLYGREPVR